VKTRTVRRTRTVPHTIDGITHMVNEEYEVQVPVPPRDWDHIVLTAVTAIAGLLVLVAVVWSTANIGDLLARVTIVAAAYAGAVAFDLAWIMCMAVEWLARYDRRRARMPRIAGHIALAVAMAAVAAHGWLEGHHAIGVIGAAVSGLVKGLWTVVLGYYAAPLDPRTQAWVEQQLAEAGAQQALIPVQRQLLRSRGAVQAERLSLGAGTTDAQDAAVDEELPKAPRPSTELRGPAGTPVEDLSSLRGMHGPIVYFLGNGNRVKIGTTRDLMSRIGKLCLRFDNLLCAFHGGHDIERRFHSLFAAYRVGTSEWFEIRGELADFIAEHTADASTASGDAPGDADDADDDAAEVSAPKPAPSPLPAGASKSALILAASSTLQPGASAADIAHLLAQHGHAVDTAYIRTVLSRNALKPDDGVGKGGGGYV
jgi:hypothetical protein